ncbi:MAG TPA: SCP2 sterol-binding domain-containing protein [Mycobacteriales bacterium]
MASVDDCRLALDNLAARMNDLDEDVRSRNAPDRTLSLRLSDLDVAFVGRIHDGSLTDIIVDGEGERAQLRLQCTSDDLLALTGGELNPAAAWASGRLRIEASPLDLLRLRSLF